jgi:hypothetical protein
MTKNTERRWNFSHRKLVNQMGEFVSRAGIVTPLAI